MLILVVSSRTIAAIGLPLLHSERKREEEPFGPQVFLDNERIVLHDWSTPSELFFANFRKSTCAYWPWIDPPWFKLFACAPSIYGEPSTCASKMLSLNTFAVRCSLCSFNAATIPSISLIFCSGTADFLEGCLNPWSSIFHPCWGWHTRITVVLVGMTIWYCG